jgi:hypothetical protein
VFEEVKKFVLAIEYSNSNNEKVTVWYLREIVQKCVDFKVS